MARVLSERDYEELQEMYRWWQQNKNNYPQFRRRNIATDSGHRTRIAYCKDDAGAGNTITCYLDTDGTGREITVYCSITQGGSALNEASPLLKGGTGTPPTGGDWMLVEKVWDGTNNYWRCSNCIFQSVLQPCACVAP